MNIKNGKDILIAGRPQYIYAGQKLMIAGRFKNNLSSKMELIVSQNGKKKKLNLPVSNLIHSELTARNFGQIATEQLENFGYATEEYSISYAKHFKVPGQTCSMLMLETEEDYKEYDINVTEDSFVVNSTLANKLIQDVLNKIGETLGDAKIKFQKWLEKLTRMPGTSFKKNASIDLICNQLSAADFSLKPKGLTCLSRTKKNVVDSIQEELSKDKLDYVRINNAAEIRKDKYSSQDALKLLKNHECDPLDRNDKNININFWPTSEPELERFFFFRKTTIKTKSLFIINHKFHLSKNTNLSDIKREPDVFQYF